MKHSYIITEDSITIHGDRRTHVVHSDNKNFEAIKNLIRSKEFDQAINLMTATTESINAFGQGKIYVQDGVVYYNGKPFGGVIVDKIFKMIEEGFDATPMINFLSNLLENPSSTAVKELYLFLATGNLPITQDGYFLAYKKVKDNYFDYYTGKFDHSPGNALEMPRFEVDDDRHRTCSTGFHFCSLKYLPAYHGSEGRVMIVKINPRDVVSIPSDYNNTKGRTCRYEVLEEYTGPEIADAFPKSVWEELSDAFDEIEDEDSDSFGDEEETDSFGEDELVVDGVKVPQQIKDMVGKTLKIGRKKFDVLDIVGKERDSKGRYTGDWSIGCDDLNRKYYVVKSAKDLLEGKEV